MKRDLSPILLGVILMAWSSAWAAPRDPDVPLTNARNDWWMIGEDAKTTTSKCIGNPKTPLCAAETVEACRIRRDKRLCRIGAGPLTIFLPDDPVIPPYEKYRINSARRLTKKNTPSWETRKNGFGFRHVGDIEIEFDTWYCDAKGGCGDHAPKHYATYLIRRTGSRWSVAGRADCPPTDVGRASGCQEWPNTLR